MVKERDQVIEELKCFSEEICRKLPVHKVFLFGSYATGNFREGSDIDVGVVLDIENIEDEIAAGVELFQSSIKIDPDIEPFPISLKDFENCEPASILAEIKRHAIFIDF